jgi:hypothetical protein
MSPACQLDLDRVLRVERARDGFCVTEVAAVGVPRAMAASLMKVPTWEALIAE